MAINFITGLPRQGKTLWALTHIKKLAEEEKRQVYYCNIPAVTIDGWIEIKDPSEWLELKDGSIIVVDELQDFWPKQQTGSKVPLPILELSKHGKRGFDFFFITQEPNLVHSTPRDLCQFHYYVVRAFGTESAMIHKFSRMQLHPEKSKNYMERYPWRYPKQAYTWYKSADVHNIKKKIPWKVWAIPIFAVLAGFMLYASWWALQNTLDKSKTSASQLAPGAPGANFLPGQTRPDIPRAQGSPARAEPMTPAQYVAAYMPRIEGLQHTAPAYDELTKPVHVPLPRACIESKRNGCKCYTQQGTPYDTTDAICRQIVQHGIFLPFETAQAAPVQPQAYQPLPQ